MMPRSLRTEDDAVGRADQSNKYSSSILSIVVALAPLPFGSVGPLPIVTWCMALAVALCMASPQSLRSRHFLVIGVVALIINFYLIVLHEQVASRPLLFRELSDSAWQAASDTLGTILSGSRSIVRDQPILALGAPLAAILSLLVGFIVCVERNHARRLLRVAAWSGTAYAVYGIVAFLIDPGKVLWMEKEAYFNVLTATFINRNTAAVHFGSCAVIWMLILLERLARRVPADTSPTLSILLRVIRTYPKFLVGCLALFACLIAMFLTGSRAGVILSLLALALALSLFIPRAFRIRRSPVRLLLGTACVAAIVLPLLGAGVLERFDNEGLASGGRFETYRSTLAIIGDHPWLGTGLGTFAWVFPAYRSKNWTSWGTWDRAHNTLLEIASEMGLPLAGVVAGCWAGAFAILIFGLRGRRRDPLVIVAALSVAPLAVLHSLIDFSLQIPGFALLVFALLGAGLAQSVSTKEQSDGLSSQNSVTSEPALFSGRHRPVD